LIHQDLVLHDRTPPSCGDFSFAFWSCLPCPRLPGRPARASPRSITRGTGRRPSTAPTSTGLRPATRRRTTLPPPTTLPGASIRPATSS